VHHKVSEGGELWHKDKVILATQNSTQRLVRRVLQHNRHKPRQRVDAIVAAAIAKLTH
jgi:hypothetical protein